MTVICDRTGKLIFQKRQYDKWRASLNIPLQNLEHNQAAGPSESTTDPRLHACSQPSRRHANRDRSLPHLEVISALVKEKKKCMCQGEKRQIFSAMQSRKKQRVALHLKEAEKCVLFVCLLAFSHKQNGSNISYFCKL